MIYAIGDDEDLEKGLSWPSPRFTDNGDGTITDNFTSLMWQEAPSGAYSSWSDRVYYANDLNLDGYTDWRLPNVNELKNLINAEESNPATWLRNRGFTNVKADAYWASTTSANDPFV